MVQAYAFGQARATGAPQDTLDRMRASLLSIEDHPESLERALLAARLADFQRYLGPDYPVTLAALDHAYDADRIVQELMTGRLFATEAEADRARR